MRTGRQMAKNLPFLGVATFVTRSGYFLFLPNPLSIDIGVIVLFFGRILLVD
jgi:hypothetical protein